VFVAVDLDIGCGVAHEKYRLGSFFPLGILLRLCTDTAIALGDTGVWKTNADITCTDIANPNNKTSNGSFRSPIRGRCIINFFKGVKLID